MWWTTIEEDQGGVVRIPGGAHRRLVVQGERSPADTGRTAAHNGSLTTNEYTVLRALNDAKPKRQILTLLETDTGIRRKTCGQIVKSLSERGLVDYSSRNRAGAAITPKGERLLALERLPTKVATKTP